MVVISFSTDKFFNDFEYERYILFVRKTNILWL